MALYFEAIRMELKTMPECSSDGCSYNCGGIRDEVWRAVLGAAFQHFENRFGPPTLWSKVVAEITPTRCNFCRAYTEKLRESVARLKSRVSKWPEFPIDCNRISRLFLSFVQSEDC